MSYLNLLDQATLFRGLRVIDNDLFARTRAAGCPYCKGTLHAAHYERKPRGERIEVPLECRIRLSLCCSVCRRRTLPPSTLYWGRRVYWSVVFLLVTAVAQGLCSQTLSALSARFGVARRTVKRWLAYFTVTFPGSASWQKLRGHLVAIVSNNGLPRSFLAWWFREQGITVQGLLQLQERLALGP